MKVHELKCVDPYFFAVVNGLKTFELRRNDRNFKVGDVLHLKRWIKDPYGSATKDYVETWIYAEDSCTRKNELHLAAETFVEVTYILRDVDLPDVIASGYCVLGIRQVTFNRVASGEQQ